MGLRIPMARAEKLKIEEGSCILGNCLPGEMILLKDDSGFAGKEIERETLNTIIHLRMREGLELLKRRLEEQAYLSYLGAGIFMTGGCSLLNGIDHLAEEIFEIPAHLAHAQTTWGVTSAVEDPQFSTAIGLVKFAQVMQTDRPRRGFGRMIGRFFSGMR
jgi:cell division protein FtsA